MNWQQMKDCASGDSEHLLSWYNQIDESRRLEEEWINSLKEEGFKAAHPNDGWVDRKNNTVILTYPYFNSGINIGDKVMLGSSYSYIVSGVPSQNKPVRITKIDDKIKCLITYHFEYIDTNKYENCYTSRMRGEHITIGFREFFSSLFNFKNKK